MGRAGWRGERKVGALGGCGLLFFLTFKVCGKERVFVKTEVVRVGVGWCLGSVLRASGLLACKFVGLFFHQCFLRKNQTQKSGLMSVFS